MRLCYTLVGAALEQHQMIGFCQEFGMQAAYQANHLLTSISISAS